MHNKEALRADMRALGRAVGAERIKKKISREELDERCGFSAGYIGRVERGEKNLKYSSIAVLSKALGLKPSWLLDKANL